MLQNYQIFDREQLKIKRIRAANSLYKADFLIKRSFHDILEKISEQGKTFKKILALGISNIKQIRSLQQYTNACIFHSGYKLEEINIYCDEENLVLEENQYDLVISILNLHNINDLPGFLLKIKRSLTKEGIFIASLFGEDNLIELKNCLIKTEIELNRGISPRTMPIIAIKQLGSLLNRAGFGSCVVDKDTIAVHYKNPITLLHDLQNMGESNILYNRNKTNPGKIFWQKFSNNYLQDYQVPTNKISASFEILTLTAYK
jgi:NADH dehydrogenase [ubiquinone] 1 alpha subcomplex assembly factor 5